VKQFIESKEYFTQRYLYRSQVQHASSMIQRFVFWIYLVFCIPLSAQEGVGEDFPDEFKSDLSQIPSPEDGQPEIESLIHTFGVGIYGGFVLVHGQTVESTRGAFPVGVEMTYSWQRRNHFNDRLCKCVPGNTISIIYFDYQSDVLGKGLIASYAIQPMYPLNKGKYFSFRAGGGIGYLTRPFDPALNPANMSYSIHFTPYLALGVGLGFPIGDDWMFKPTVLYHHASNGALSQPNEGLNWPTVGLGLSYQTSSVQRTYKSGPRIGLKRSGIRWDIGVYGGRRNVLRDIPVDEYAFIGGVSFQGAVNVGKISNLIGGVVVHYDGDAQKLIELHHYNKEPLALGILVGHEFVLGRFLFTQRIGTYAYKPTPTLNRIFHKWGLTYRFNRHWGAGLQMLAHLQEAYITDLQIVYSL
jgi:hypothetical protein